jgi:protein-disulfide isomerase
MIDAGQSFQVRGTPTVIINNRILGGNVLQISRELLRLADLSSKGGTPKNNPNEKE